MDAGVSAFLEWGLGNCFRGSQTSFGWYIRSGGFFAHCHFQLVQYSPNMNSYRSSFRSSPCQFRLTLTPLPCLCLLDSWRQQYRNCELEVTSTTHAFQYRSREARAVDSSSLSNLMCRVEGEPEGLKPFARQWCDSLPCPMQKSQFGSSRWLIFGHVID